MDELFYTKYKNLHITNDLNYINPYNLQEGDNINILSGDENITQINLKFCNIKNNNIINFLLMNKKNDYNFDYGYNNQLERAKDFYYHNNQYLSIKNEQIRISLNFNKHIVKMSKNNMNKRYISGKFIDENETYSYLIFPSEGNYIKILINIDLCHNEDYLIYLEKSDNYIYYSPISYKIDMVQFIKILNIKETKPVKWFKDLLFCKDYNTKEYITDIDRDKNYIFVNNFLQENFNKNFKINLCFKNKELNLKSYIENKEIIISHNDKVVNFLSGRSSNDFYFKYLDENRDLQMKPCDYSNDIEFQQWYMIAYDIALFEINKNPINPKTGEIGLLEKIIDNEQIIYKDSEHIIVSKGRDNIFYKKINDYFIMTTKQTDIIKILELYNIVNTLTDESLITYIK